MYKSEVLLAKTQPYQVPLYEDKVIYEIFQAGGLVKKLGIIYDTYIFDDESILVNFAGDWQAFAPPKEQTPLYPGKKWQDYFICAACNCKINEKKPSGQHICGDCQFDREPQEYYGLRECRLSAAPKTLAEIFKGDTNVPILNLTDEKETS